MAGNDEWDTVELPALPNDTIPVQPVASSGVRVDLMGLSHTGKVRANNEDHFFAARFDRAMQTLLTNLPPGEVPDASQETVYGFVVADGMGGEAAGEVASRKAIASLVDLVLRTPDWIMLFDEQRVRQVERRMEERFRKVREALNDHACRNPDLFGMGTTMTVACSLGADLVITHAGDSRAYLFRYGQLTRLTRDQTLAQELVDHGAIRPDEAATSPLRHRLTGAISTKMKESPAVVTTTTLLDGDQLLLCTDGLNDMVSDEAIAQLLHKKHSAADACRLLVEMALERGGRDNVTVVLAKYHMPD
jgi:protein phosphatase